MYNATALFDLAFAAICLFLLVVVRSAEERQTTTSPS